MRILYVTTSFPVYSETFLQRELRALLQAGAELEIVSLHRGETSFEGYPIFRFRKWNLLRLLYLFPWAVARRGRSMLPLVREMTRRKPPSALNFWENLLGFGAAIVCEKRILNFKPDIVHCVWASAPAAFGMLSEILTGKSFSTGAHAYDIFEGGGDWLLQSKLSRAALVHVSTDVAADRIRDLCSPKKVKRIRRGMNALPPKREPRISWEALRIVCIARLVEKKGFPYQIEIYRHLKDAGISFEAIIIGEGPLEDEILEQVAEAGLEGEVSLRGRLSEKETLEELQRVDLLFHTGIVAASGDRDGLPNVVPEAMASGTIVIGSPVSGVIEAIEDGQTGFLCSPWEPELWVRRCQALIADFELRRRLANNARDWVEKEFLASRNTQRLLEELERACHHR